MPTPKLLEPIQVGPLTLKNRVMFPPLTTGYEERDGSIGPRSLAFYERLAKGGVAYIVIGDVAPVNTASPTPKLADDSQIPSFAALADAVHAHGAKLALQLFHPEYDVPGVGRLIMASRMAAVEAQKAQAAGDAATFEAKMAESKKIASDAYAKLHHDMQHFVSEATVEQLAEIKDAIAAAARRAQQAGVDAIEVHGDRLVGSLCSPLLNHRTDDYGGSFENRVRYALEVVAAIKEAAPALMVEYKLPVIMTNPDGSKRGKGGLEPDEACELAVLLERAGVDMIQVAQANHTGNMGDTIPPMGTMPYNWTLPVAERVKGLVGVPVATVGRVVTPEAGEKILEDGQADVIGYGRSLLADPDIALKVASGEPVRLCLNCNKGCVDAIQGRRYISCVLNAENGDEAAVYRGVYLFIKLFVGLAEYVASLAVAYEDVRRAYLGNHRAGGLAGEGSALFPVHIFSADYYGQFFCCVYRRQQRNCGNEEGYLFGPCGYGFLYLFRVLQFGAEFAKEFTCRRRAVVHLPVSGDEFSAHFIFLQLSSYRLVRKSRRNGHFPTPLGALL